MHVYHVPGTRSDRVVWALEELGDPYEVTVLKGEDRETPEHLQRHPLGRVPVVSDNEGYLFESAGLCLHLADLHPEASLAPAAGTHERALLYQWLFFAMTEVEPPLVDIYVQEQLSDEPDDELVAAARARFDTVANVIERELAERDYLLPSGFSVADIVMGKVVDFAIGMGLAAGLVNLAAYQKRLHARPAFARISAAGTTTAET
ncbi:MAG: glutathione S-transferase family protein [Actinomycetia bacterium]|nr:glutathione S-transferase family protein [Actinomycetes bacterium]